MPDAALPEIPSMTSPTPSSDNVGPARKAKVLIVEDHMLVRAGLAGLIDDEPDLTTCGGASSIAAGRQAAKALHPDIVIVDLTLEGENGLDLIKLLREDGLRVLVLSMHDESVYAERALRAGAHGYIMKKEPAERVMSAIRRVLGGEIYLSEQMASKLVAKLVDPQNARRQALPLERLSEREYEIFTLIARGIGPSKIARSLGVSVKTIETHREHIKAKLSLKSSAELIRFAMENSIPLR